MTGKFKAVLDQRPDQPDKLQDRETYKGFSRFFIWGSDQTVSDNRLTSVVAGGVTTTMVYDYDGNLVQKTVGGQVTRYVYAGGPAPIVEINVNTGAQKDFIQANGRTWGVMEATQNTYFHHDAIGSVVALSNDSGQVTDTYEYEPFGKLLNHQGTSTNDYQFVGGYGVRKLNDTLDTMGMRQYSEKVGRFTTQDPMGTGSDDKNLYRYVRNAPENYFDPTGLARICTRNLDRGIPGNGNDPLVHMQIWFDGGSNLGYFQNGYVGSDDGHSINEYSCGSDYYDDDLMLQAALIVAGQWPFSDHIYAIPWPDCQTYARTVLATYRILEGKQKHCNQ